MDRHDHYLITRFNVLISNWDRDKEGVTTLDDAWMKHRIGLFNQFCAPSVAGQTHSDFKWLIYCDPATAPHFVEDIRRSISMIPNTEVRFVNNFDLLKSDLKQVISTGTNPYVITSRVDNDDALGNTYIGTIQSSFIPENLAVINLCGGALYDLHQSVLTRLPDMRLNHFGSLIEKRNNTGEYLTVMGFSHHDPPQYVKLINIETQYAWLKIIHQRNLNSRTIGVPVFFANVSQHFNLDKKAMPVSRVNTIVYFFRRGMAVLKRKIKNGL